MKIVSKEDNLHAMSKPVFWERREIINLSSAELVQRVVMVKFFFMLRTNHFDITMYMCTLITLNTQVA